MKITTPESLTTANRPSFDYRHALVTLVVLAPLLAACGGQSTAEQPTSAPSQPTTAPTAAAQVLEGCQSLSSVKDQSTLLKPDVYEHTDSASTSCSHIEKIQAVIKAMLAKAAQNNSQACVIVGGINDHDPAMDVLLARDENDIEQMKPAVPNRVAVHVIQAADAQMRINLDQLRFAAKNNKPRGQYLPNVNLYEKLGWVLIDHPEGGKAWVAADWLRPFTDGTEDACNPSDPDGSSQIPSGPELALNNLFLAGLLVMKRAHDLNDSPVRRSSRRYRRPVDTNINTTFGNVLAVTGLMQSLVKKPSKRI